MAPQRGLLGGPQLELLGGPQLELLNGAGGVAVSEGPRLWLLVAVPEHDAGDDSCFKKK